MKFIRLTKANGTGKMLINLDQISGFEEVEGRVVIVDLDGTNIPIKETLDEIEEKIKDIREVI